MIDVFAPSQTRLRIRRVTDDAVEIKTPFMLGNREYLQAYTETVEWDDFSGVWSGICREDSIYTLAMAIKVRFGGVVAIEQGGELNPSPTAPWIAPEKKVELV